METTRSLTTRYRIGGSLARKRRGRKNPAAEILAAVIILVGLHLYNSGDLGKLLYGFFLITLFGGLLAAIYSLSRKESPIELDAARRIRKPDISTPKGEEFSINQPEPGALAEPDEILNNYPSEDPPVWTSQDTSPQAWSLDVLVSLEWKRFETVCAEYFRLIGYDPKETRIGADGGVDIWVYKQGNEKPFGIVQCKAWSTYKVGIKPIRELFGVMAAEGVNNGMFITSGEFTKEALEFAEGKRLRLISGEIFLDYIGKLPPEKQKDLLDLALEGDYGTPTCPQCGIKMTLRRAKGSGKEFWGCLRYPRCKATLVFKQTRS